MSDSTKFRQWETDLIWLWDQLLDAERGRYSIGANTLARSAVEAVKAHIADAGTPAHTGRGGPPSRPVTSD